MQAFPGRTQGCRIDWQEARLHQEGLGKEGVPDFHMDDLSALLNLQEYSETV